MGGHGAAADGEQPDGQPTDGEQADRHRANGRYPQREGADRQQAHSQGADAENAQTQDAEGEAAACDKSNGHQTGSHIADGQNTAGPPFSRAEIDMHQGQAAQSPRAFVFDDGAMIPPAQGRRGRRIRLRFRAARAHQGVHRDAEDVAERQQLVQFRPGLAGIT